MSVRIRTGRTSFTDIFVSTQSYVLQLAPGSGGTGHMAQKAKQGSFFQVSHRHRYSHGGLLRRHRAGRKQRPLACKEALHVVFKIRKEKLRCPGLRSAKSFQMIHSIIGQYSRRFFIKIEHMSIQNDHIHCLIRTTRRSHFHYFFRVVSGQIAQRFQKEGLLFAVTARRRVTDTPQPGASPQEKAADRSRKPRATFRKRVKGTQLWLYRPFSRVVIGWSDFKRTKNYIQLNEQEAQGKIKYQKRRLKGLSSAEWELLWS